MKFKNLRCPSRTKKAGINVAPLPKKIRIESDKDEAGYDCHVKYLRQSYSSKKVPINSILAVFEQTAQQRRNGYSVSLLLPSKKL